MPSGIFFPFWGSAYLIVIDIGTSIFYTRILQKSEQLFRFQSYPESIAKEGEEMGNRTTGSKQFEVF